jgi:hypothetical protein
LKSGWGEKKKKRRHHWLNYLSSSQNGQKNLIHNWCVYGCCVTQQVLACSKKAHTHTRAPWALLALLPIYPMVVFFLLFYLCSFSFLWLCGFILMVVFSLCLSIFVAIQWLYTNTHTFYGYTHTHTLTYCGYIQQTNTHTFYGYTHTHTHILWLYTTNKHTHLVVVLFLPFYLCGFFLSIGSMVVFFLPFYLCCVHTHILSFWLFFFYFALYTHTHTF